MKDQEIKKILQEYENSYSPWELEGGDCPQYDTSSLIDFGRRMYELGKSQSDSTYKSLMEEYLKDNLDKYKDMEVKFKK